MDERNALEHEREQIKMYLRMFGPLLSEDDLNKWLDRMAEINRRIDELNKEE